MYRAWHCIVSQPPSKVSIILFCYCYEIGIFVRWGLVYWQLLLIWLRLLSGRVLPASLQSWRSRLTLFIYTNNHIPPPAICPKLILPYTHCLEITLYPYKTSRRLPTSNSAICFLCQMSFFLSFFLSFFIPLYLSVFLSPLSLSLSLRSVPGPPGSVSCLPRPSVWARGGMPVLLPKGLWHSSRLPARAR